MVPEEDQLRVIGGHQAPDLLQLAGRNVHRDLHRRVHEAFDDLAAGTGLKIPDRNQRDVDLDPVEARLLEIGRLEGGVAHVQHLHAADLHQVPVIVDAGVLGAVAQRKDGHPYAIPLDHFGHPILRVDDVHTAAVGGELAAKLAHQADTVLRRTTGGALACRNVCRRRRADCVRGGGGCHQPGRCWRSRSWRSSRYGVGREAAIDRVGLLHHLLPIMTGLANVDDHAGVGQPRDRNVGLQRTAEDEQQENLNGLAIY
jgi:hypothetical protein